MLVDGGRDVVARWVHRQFPHVRAAWQHIDYPAYDDCPVEIHYRAIYANNPLYNHRLQCYLAALLPAAWSNNVDLPDGAGRIAVPTVKFNIVYQLSHMMHHFFDEGIGLRQMMDYYYLLLAATGDGAARSDSEAQIAAGGDEALRCDALQELQATLKYLNLYDFAGAVMFVMRDAFGLDERYYIAPVDEWRGRTLMDEIMQGGNFGHNRKLERLSAWRKYWFKTRRNLRFVRQYPAEALCEPLFRTWHFFWRVCHR